MSGPILTLHGTPKLLRAIKAVYRHSPSIVYDSFHELGSYKTPRAADKVRARDSRLAASLAPSVTGRRRPTLRIGSPLPQAAIVHHGGTITTRERAGRPVTPAHARRRVFGYRPINYLTIPLTRLGTPKHARARDYQNLFVFKSRRGKLYLAQRTTTASSVRTRRTSRGFASRNGRSLSRAGKGQSFRILFALRESVTIKPHPYLSWEPEDRNFLARSLRNQYLLATKR